MSKDIKVMVTGAGSPGAPGVIKSLRKVSHMNIEIIGVDTSAYATGFPLSDDFYTIPKANDSNFISDVLTICKSEKIDVILPMVTKELLEFAMNKQLFLDSGTIVSVSDYNNLVIANDKGRLLHKLALIGIPTPKSEIVQTAETLKEAIYRLGYPQHSVCFKPTISNGSRGFRILDPNINRASLLFKEKPNSTYTSMNDLFDILEQTDEIPEIIVMEYLPGKEYSVDVLADNGKVVTAIPRLREAMVGGITTSGVVVNETDIIEYASKVVSELGLHGNIGVQIRRNADNEPRILEINPRMQGTIVHCLGAGVNLPYLAIKLVLGIPIEPHELLVKWGTRMNRYWEEIYYDSNGSPYSL
ncbi:ATP-grasp domain-containing protein [Brevibacillus sp. IT-7CA2]|uniref:ATP-grasp domain-containing protein n=1 Tax=Brevibacillus sp. IT-7CA2 TaxID=3026436 RepID=UPI0039DF7936